MAEVSRGKCNSFCNFICSGEDNYLNGAEWPADCQDVQETGTGHFWSSEASTHSASCCICVDGPSFSVCTLDDVFKALLNS